MEQAIAPKVYRCGTTRGHRRHRTLGETPCEPCRIAWNAECRKKQQELRESGWVRPGRNPNPKRNVVCSVCGEPIIRTGKCGATPRHRKCRPEKFWANAIQISDVGRRAIYDRDGWVCQICHEPVDRELDPQDRMAATLDHVVPRSLTLFPDDSPANLRLAHRSCNSRRGNRAA